jgi:hypothetical protein
MEKNGTASWLHCLQKVKVKLNLSMPFMESRGTRWGWVVACIPQTLYAQNVQSMHPTVNWMSHRAGLDIFEKRVLPPLGFKLQIVQPIA